MGWSINRLSGRVGDLHDAEPDPTAGRQVQIMDIEGGAVVLGSTQAPDVLDLPRIEAAGFDVVHRRSGGGVVLLLPSRTLWVDFFLPAGDRLWTDDVSSSFVWLGELWESALRGLGHDAALSRASVRPDELGRLVCFAAVGRGEVTLGGRKVVGFSQRRTRAGSRFQSAALLRWDPDELVAVFDDRRMQAAVEAVTLPGEADARSQLNERVAALGSEPAEVLSALCSHLPIG